VTRRPPPGVGVVVVLGAVAGARWAAAAPPTFHAEPAVGVVETSAIGTGSGSGSGMIVLHNDSAGSVTAGSITAEPGCDTAAVHTTPLGPFTLGPGATRTLMIACTPEPASMRRCNYRVRAPAGSVLLELEAVCAYAGMATLVPDAASVDLGAVAIGSSASHTFTLHHTGALSISKLFVTTTDLAGNFTVQAPCNPDARECDAAIPAVAAGGTTTLTVACTPRTPGPQAAQLYVTTSAGTQLTAPIALACTGIAAAVPVISVSPAIDVGAVEVIGATAQATVHIANAGTGMLKLLDVQIVDGGTGAAADWTYTALAPCGAHIPPACTLIDNQTVDLDLVFDPSAIGLRDATLLVNYHDTADRSISVPLHGLGRGATLDLVGGTKVLDFGTLPINTTAVLTLHVANRGTRDLTDGAVSVMPAGPFTINPGPSFLVPANATIPVAVSCKPTAPGLSAADLQLSAPDVQSPPIVVSLRCNGDPATTLTATPPAILLGEVRLDIPAPATATTTIASTGAPVTLTSAVLQMMPPALSVSGVPATTPAILTLSARPADDGDLTDRLLVTPSTGTPLAIAVTGTAVTAMYNVPAAVSLGTFCVQQPTTPRILPLTSTGSATLAIITPPALVRSDSPFDLAFVAPTLYPATLAPMQSAVITATPKRQATAGVATDDVTWTTDIAGAAPAHTTLTATFIDNGGAIAPPALDFADAPIHLDTRNAQQVTLRNCDISPLELDPPQIAAPFSIDSPNFPAMLLPGETSTFSVGFHPTKLGMAMKTLVITSPQLTDVELTVMLTGNGVAVGGGGDGGVTGNSAGSTSFYACSGCASGGPSSALAMTLAALCLLAPRRRRPRP
jgi:MYXO-CTERM domain-containing protein